MKAKKYSITKELAFITIGTIILSCAYGIFLIPNKIAPGGFSGIAALINYATGLPAGTMSFVLNIPVLIIAWRMLGHKFVLKTLYATFLFSVLLDIVPFVTLTNEGVLACVYGGVCTGIGIGMVFLGFGSTGGVDLAATLIHQRKPELKTGYIMAAIDILVIIAAAIITGAEKALYSIIALFVSTWMINFVTEGLHQAKLFMIVTAKRESIEKRILFELKRGVTQLDARGAYTNSNITMLLCVVERMSEVTRLRRIIREEDNSAFMVALSAREVLGNGFGN